MIVVLDTNIWRSSLYLKAGAAAAMRFYLRQKGAKVGLPEVIRLEVERHLRHAAFRLWLFHLPFFVPAKLAASTIAHIRNRRRTFAPVKSARTGKTTVIVVSVNNC